MKKIMIGIVIILGIIIAMRLMPSITEDEEFKETEEGVITLIEKEEQEDEEDEDEVEEEYKGKSLPNFVFDDVRQVASEHLINFEFTKAVNSISNNLEGYNTEDSEVYNDYLDTYKELALMSKFESMKEYGEDSYLRESIEGLRVPDNFLISVMWLDSFERRYLIKTSKSLNPIFNGGVIIKKSKIVEKEDSPHLKNVEISIKDIKEIIEYEIEIEENELLAYVVVDSSGNLFFYTMIEKVEGSTSYITIEKLDSYLNTIKGNLSNDKTKKPVEEKIEDAETEEVEDEDEKIEEGDTDNE